MDKPIKILIVEDDRLTAASLKHMLEKNGIQVVGIKDDYPSALYSFIENKPDLVIMDLSLQMDEGNRFSGIVAATEMVEHYNAKVIFTTATKSKQAIDAMSQVDFASFIPKPAAEELVLETIRKALQKRSFA